MYLASKAQRKSAILKLESLEGREVPSATPMSPEPSTVCPHCGSSGFCALYAPPGYVSQPDPVDTTGTKLVSLEDAFNLNSRPESNKTIYLNFEGSTTAGTAWNSGGPPVIITPPYSTDANTAVFSQTELNNIYQIWNRTAEFFRIFDVNVTTKKPPVSDLDYTGVGDLRYGIQADIGGDGAWLGSPGVLGIAYLNTFGSPSRANFSPAFVFSDGLNNNADVAYVIAHELGHNFGLRHDGTTFPDQEYYGGHAGAGAPSWAPVMGNGFGRTSVAWSRGEYLFPSNTFEDDIALIGAQTGFVPDDIPNNLGSAVILSESGNNVTGAGVINDTADVDVFRFTTNAGAINISVIPGTASPTGFPSGAITTGGMLKVQVELIDSTGTVLQTFNPPTQMSATVAFNIVQPGTYFLRVRGVGAGTPEVASPSGFTNYSSNGSYTISGTIVPLGPPDTPLPGRVTSMQTLQNATGAITGFRVGFNTGMDINSMNRDTIAITGPNGTAIPFTRIVRVPFLLNTFDVQISPRSFDKTLPNGGFRIYFDPSMKSLRDTNLDINNNATPGELDDYFSGSTFAFRSTTPAALPNSSTTTNFPLTISTTPNFSISDINVSVDITASNTGDLLVSLVSPTNVVIPLFNRRGNGWANLINTQFDDSSLNLVTDGKAGYRNVFKPDGGTLSTLNGLTINGTWNLRVQTFNSSGGSVNSWGITATNTSARTPLSVTSITPENKTSSILARRYNSVLVNFNNPVNQKTFTTADVRIIDPSGRQIAPTKVTFVTPTQARVEFPMLNRIGRYNVRVGPNITDVFGNLMDVNNNGRYNQPTDFYQLPATPANDQRIVVDANVYRSATKINTQDNRTVSSAIFIPDIATISNLAVEVNLQHPLTSNLRISLLGPDGFTRVPLITNRGAGANLQNTVFSDAAATLVSAGSAPFNNAFRPEQPLNATFANSLTRGFWRLQIEDTVTGSTGQLQDWALYIQSVYRNTTQVAIPDNSVVTSTINVTDNITISDISVQVNALHTATGNLRISLVGPDGLTTVQLFNQRGGTNDNLTNTIFSDSGATSISTASAPFTGTFRPEQALNTTFGGTLAKGIWTLRIEDLSPTNTGTLQNWSLFIR